MAELDRQKRRQGVVNKRSGKHATEASFTLIFGTNIPQPT